MQVLFIVGRMIFALTFVFCGTQILLDIAGASAVIGNKFAVSVDATSYIESAIGMSTSQIAAILTGASEIAAGFFLAFNVGIRFAATLLILLTVLHTYFVHDFWNMSGAARYSHIVQAVQNISIIGALLVFVAGGPSLPGERKRDIEI